jgi:hypothetical protein
MPTVCATCSVSYKDDERVACDICKIVQHGVCLGLSRTEISVLRNPNRRISFFCQNCNLVETVRSLKDELQSLKNEIDQLKSATKTNGENIEVKALISPTNSCSMRWRIGSNVRTTLLLATWRSLVVLLLTRERRMI